MTRERFKELFDRTESGRHGDGAFRGLLIIAPYFDVTKQSIIRAAEHDVIYGPNIDDLLESGLSEEDAVSLAKFNWFIDKDADAIAHWV